MKLAKEKLNELVREAESDWEKNAHISGPANVFQRCRRIFGWDYESDEGDGEDERRDDRRRRALEINRQMVEDMRCLREQEDFKIKIAEAEAWKLVEGNFYGPPQKQLRLLLRDLGGILLETKLNEEPTWLENKYFSLKAALRNWSLETCALLMRKSKGVVQMFPVEIFNEDKFEYKLCILL